MVIHFLLIVVNICINPKLLIYPLVTTSLWSFMFKLFDNYAMYWLIHQQPVVTCFKGESNLVLSSRIMNILCIQPFIHFKRLPILGLHARRYSHNKYLSIISRRRTFITCCLMSLAGCPGWERLNLRVYSITKNRMRAPWPMLKLTGQQQSCSVPCSKLEDHRHFVLSGSAW